MTDLTLNGMLHDARCGTEGRSCRTPSTPPPNRDLVTRDFGLRSMLDAVFGNSENSGDREAEENCKQRSECRGLGIGDMLRDAVHGSG